jgi:hypothetical protein
MSTDPFTFDHIPTAEEVEKFEYASYGYFELTPGYSSNVFVSYVGVYFDEKGNLSGIYVANSSVTQY